MRVVSYVDYMAWERFPHQRPFVGGIRRTLMEFPHNGLGMPTFESFFVAICVELFARKDICIHLIMSSPRPIRFTWNAWLKQRQHILNITAFTALIMQDNQSLTTFSPTHDDVIKWKHFPRYWPLVRGIHRLTVNSPHKGQWRGALMFSLICAWINGWVNNHEAGDLRRHHAHYDVTVMLRLCSSLCQGLTTKKHESTPVSIVLYLSRLPSSL